MNSWKVEIKKSVAKQLERLPQNIVVISQLLVNDMKHKGPTPGPGWPNFSKLSKNKYHCHLQKGKPTYVACWEIIDKKQKIIEVYYVGTHEKAPY